MNQDFIEKAKKHFEANMLDGEDVFDCGKAMLSAESVWEYLKSALKEAMGERDREIEVIIRERQVWNAPTLIRKLLTPPSTKE